MKQWIVVTEKERYDIGGRYLLCYDAYAIEAVYDKIDSRIQRILAFDECPVPVDDLLYRILGIEHIEQFSPSRSLNLRFVLFTDIIRHDDIELLIVDQTLLHIYILEEPEVCLALRLERRILYLLDVPIDIIEIIPEIQEGVAHQYLNRIFQSVEEFLVLLQDDLLFIAILEIKVDAVDPEDSSQSSVLHNDRIVPYFGDRQHRLCIEEILRLFFLYLILIS